MGHLSSRDNATANPSLGVLVRHRASQLSARIRGPATTESSSFALAPREPADWRGQQQHVRLPRRALSHSDALCTGLALWPVSRGPQGRWGPRWRSYRLGLVTAHRIKSYCSPLMETLSRPLSYVTSYVLTANLFTPRLRGKILSTLHFHERGRSWCTLVRNQRVPNPERRAGHSAT